MQYAVAVALEPLLVLAPAGTGAALQPVVDRMKAEQPQARFATLADAAEALRAVLPALPMASERHFGPLSPEDLLGPGGQSDPAKREETFHWPPAAAAASANGVPSHTPSRLMTTALTGQGTALAGDATEVLDTKAPAGPASTAEGTGTRPARMAATDVVAVDLDTAAPAVSGQGWLWLVLVAAAGAAAGVLAPLPW